MSPISIPESPAAIRAAKLSDLSRKPDLLPFNRDGIPPELRQARYVVYRVAIDRKAGMWKKIPIDPETGSYSDDKVGTIWRSFDEALAAPVEKDGVGLVAAGGWGFLDIDSSIDPVTGKPVPAVQELIDELGTWAEQSYFGGIHIPCKISRELAAQLANGDKKLEFKGLAVEVYFGDRYCALTGHQIAGTPSKINDIEGQLRKYLTPVEAASTATIERPRPSTATAVGKANDAAYFEMVRRLDPADDKSDGTNRLYQACCRCVEHDLSEDDAVATIHKYMEVCPFPVDHDEKKIVEILRDAEKSAKRGTAATISNAKLVSKQSDDGSTIMVPVPRPLNEIVDDVHRLSDGWPRKIGAVPFVDDPDHDLRWFDRDRVAGMFAWLKSNFKVDWRKGSNYVSQPELVSQLGFTAERYAAVELLAHEPKIDGVYYRCQFPAPGDGTTLAALLDKFRPATDDDRHLIQAAFMTVVWGGPAGQRPVFVIDSDQGRGVGKSKIPEFVGQLCGGMLDVNAGEDIKILKERLLSPDGQTKRVAVLDNVKSLKFSWAELEALITAPTISGKQLYVGEGQRPNLLTWFITLNGVAMATDMAQRSVVIKLRRGLNSGTWYDDTRAFIDEHRDRIVGDLIAALRAEQKPLSMFSRWGTWDDQILRRLSDPDKVAALILERQGQANCDLDEAQIVEQEFADQLRGLNYDPDNDRVRIPSRIVAQWFSKLSGKQVAANIATRKLNHLKADQLLTRLEQDAGHGGNRGWIWSGRDSNFETPIQDDLIDRLWTAEKRSA